LTETTGASEVDKEDDMFVLIAPQNAVGNCIIDVILFLLFCSKYLYNTHLWIFIDILENLQDMRAMTDAAGDRPVILVNPRLKVLTKKIYLFSFIVFP
jgi:adenylate kinase